MHNAEKPNPPASVRDTEWSGGLSASSKARARNSLRAVAPQCAPSGEVHGEARDGRLRQGHLPVCNPSVNRAKTKDDAEFRSRVHPANRIDPRSPSLLIRRSSVKLYDPENQPIVACSQEDWDLAVKIMSSGRMRRFGECATAYQGEVNETTDGKKGNISTSPSDGPQILRGSNVCLYYVARSVAGRTDLSTNGEVP